jgi:transposase
MLKKKKIKKNIYECLNCKSIMDRDYNGAKNIFLLGIKKIKFNNRSTV